MKHTSKSLVFFLLLTLLSAGCVTSKKTTYLQESKKDLRTQQKALQKARKTGAVAWTPPSAIPQAYKILPSDNLFIRVITPDPKWAVMFNTLPVTTTTFSITEQSTDL